MNGTAMGGYQNFLELEVINKNNFFTATKKNR